MCFFEFRGIFGFVRFRGDVEVEGIIFEIGFRGVGYRLCYGGRDKCEVIILFVLLKGDLGVV